MSLRRNRLKDLGAFRQRITLYETTRVADDVGGFERVDPSDATKIDTFWGLLRPVVGRETSIAEQFTDVITHECWLRYGAPLEPGMILSEGGMYYYVSYFVDPDMMRRYWLAMLREGGPL